MSSSSSSDEYPTEIGQYKNNVTDILQVLRNLKSGGGNRVVAEAQIVFLNAK